MEMISTLTSANQTTVPEEFARELGLVPGTRFEWMAGEEPNTILIRVLPSKRQVLDQIQEIGATLRNRRMIEELIDERAGD